MVMVGSEVFFCNATIRKIASTCNNKGISAATCNNYKNCDWNLQQSVPARLFSLNKESSNKQWKIQTFFLKFQNFLENSNVFGHGMQRMA